ncbi:MAG: hypothetical protein WC917_00525 [Bacilli bacterium]|jgi:hypothetical protein
MCNEVTRIAAIIESATVLLLQARHSLEVEHLLQKEKDDLQSLFDESLIEFISYKTIEDCAKPTIDSLKETGKKLLAIIEKKNNIKNKR